ncbi:MAG: hypothetical protein FWF60_07485 [Oscillospiraceae bacterium]|nr:hypothetical protein [Oscillospiraceae bacterium]
MASITRSYPSIVKWLKAARAAALKERGDKFMVAAREDCTYITDGVCVLRIPAARVPAWTAACNLAPVPGQEMNAGLLETVRNLLAPSPFDETLLDTDVLAYCRCQADTPLCRVYACEKVPFVIREVHAASLREVGGPVTVQQALSESYRYPAKAVIEGGLAVAALPIRLGRDWKQERILKATAKAAQEIEEHAENP